MSKLTQIETKLKEIDAAKFQRLCDAYLYQHGYQRINALGLVIGADKVAKGTPDTLISLPNGQYVFVEYTTQQQAVSKKFQDDLAKCFDETKTGIPLEKIQEIILCHTSRLTAAEEDILHSMCQQHACMLSIFGVWTLAHDLYQKFPGLARDFLEVEVDTGQVITLPEFVTAYNKSTLTTPLDTAFHFRESDIEHVRTSLETHDLVIVSGHAGVGKSRLALECCTLFLHTHPAFEIRCIFNLGPDLFADLLVHFTPPGSYLILVDDANRVNGFEYVLQLLYKQNEARKIKIIATVRDYALEKVRGITRRYGGGVEVALEPLTDEQISTLVSDEVGVRNPMYLERIAHIAQGNPRLAMMAARVAKRENTLHSISNVSALYDEYFTSMRQDIDELGDTHLLKVAGIVSFFRTVDRSNAIVIRMLTHAFDISSEQLWAAARRLHALEVLDMYEDEVVRPADQVLATYLLYLAFFKERVLTFSTLLEHFFPDFRHRLIDMLNSLLGAFDHKVLLNAMRPHVDQVWRVLEQERNEESQLHFLAVFWFLKETDTLLYISSRIAAMKPDQVEIATLQFKPDGSIRSPSILSVLALFPYTDEMSRRMALDLLLDYLAKRPQKLSQVLHILIEDFGFKHTSDLQAFAIQNDVIDVLWERTCKEEPLLYAKVFITVAEAYLHTRFHTTEPQRRQSIKLINFQLPSTPEALDLRSTIWQHLFSLYQIPPLRQNVLDVLNMYNQFIHQATDTQIIARDAAELLPFITSELDPTSYTHCRIVQNYLQILSTEALPFDKTLNSRFTNTIYNFSQILLDHSQIRRSLDWRAYSEQKHTQIKAHIAGFQVTDYVRFWEQCVLLRAELHTDQEIRQFQSTILTVFLVLADTNPNLYIEVMEYYLRQGNFLNLDHVGLPMSLINACGTERAYDILTDSEYRYKNNWLFGFFMALPTAACSREWLARLYQLYQVASVEELPHSVDYLIRYLSVDRGVFVSIVKTLVAKADQDARYGVFLISLFDPHPEINLQDLFAHNVDLLKRAYFAAHMAQDQADYEGTAFNLLLNLDPTFGQAYVERMFHKGAGLTRAVDHRNYSFLWKRDDYTQIMEDVIHAIYALERNRQLLEIDSYLDVFFVQHGQERIDPEIAERQDYLIRHLIERRHADVEFMQFVFSVIAKFSAERRKHLLSIFLAHNTCFDDFIHLSIAPNSWGYIGSAVPALQERVGFFESLLPLFKTVDLLQHKQSVERRIQALQTKIDHQKKQDFMND